MAYREIPEGSVEVQTGLWAYRKTLTFNGTTVVKHNLYSSEGYCFYIISANLDEEGNLRPEYERMYAQYASSAYSTIDQINADVVSVPVQPGYEIVSVGTNHETI